MVKYILKPNLKYDQEKWIIEGTVGKQLFMEMVINKLGLSCASLFTAKKGQIGRVGLLLLKQIIFKWGPNFLRNI